MHRVSRCCSGLSNRHIHHRLLLFSSLRTLTMVRNRFCSSNSSFFKSWSPCMAYWLGFLFADGNVYKSSNSNHSHTVGLGLKCTDHSHVEKYQHALQSTYHLGLYRNG
eukprot:256217_1